MIYINDKEYPYTGQNNLLSILQELNFITFQGIAVAINSIVISKTAWGKYIIQDGDKITIIRATQGG